MDGPDVGRDDVDAAPGVDDGVQAVLDPHRRVVRRLQRLPVRPVLAVRRGAATHAARPVLDEDVECAVLSGDGDRVAHLHRPLGVALRGAEGAPGPEGRGAAGGGAALRRRHDLAPVRTARARQHGPYGEEPQRAVALTHRLHLALQQRAPQGGGPGPHAGAGPGLRPDLGLSVEDGEGREPPVAQGLHPPLGAGGAVAEVVRPAGVLRAVADLAVAAAGRVAAVLAVDPAVYVEYFCLVCYGGPVEAVGQEGDLVADVAVDGRGPRVRPAPVLGQGGLREVGGGRVVLVVVPGDPAQNGRDVGVVRFLRQVRGVRVEGPYDGRPVALQHGRQGVDHLLAGVAVRAAHRAGRRREGGELPRRPQPQAAQALLARGAHVARLDQLHEDQLDLRGGLEGLQLDLEAGHQREALHRPRAEPVAGGHVGGRLAQTVDPGTGELRALLGEFGVAGAAAERVAAVGLAAGHADGHGRGAAAYGLLELGVHEVQGVVGVRHDVDERLRRSGLRGPRGELPRGVRPLRVRRQPLPGTHRARTDDQAAAGGLEHPTPRYSSRHACLPLFPAPSWRGVRGWAIAMNRPQIKSSIL